MDYEKQLVLERIATALENQNKILNRLSTFLMRDLTLIIMRDSNKESEVKIYGKDKA